MSNVNAGGDTDRLTVRVTHTTRQPIGSGTRKHLVGTNDMEGMDPHTDVVGILTDGGGQMLVDGNTGCLKRFTRNLLFFVTDQMSDEGEEIDWCLFGTLVMDADF